MTPGGGSSGKWHAARCAGRPGAAVSSGSSCSQRSWAIGQRVRNRQPAGIRSGLGGSPLDGRRALAGAGRHPRDGGQQARGCRGGAGAAYSSSVGATSMIRPRYITATRSHRCRTTARLCEMSSRVRPRLAAQVLEQVQDRGLHADVQRRHRLVGHQQVRRQGQRPGDRDALPLAAGELPRVGRAARRRSARPARSAPGCRSPPRPRGTMWCTRSSSCSMPPTVSRGFSDEYGSWKTIWTRRWSAREPAAAPAPRRPA